MRDLLRHGARLGDLHTFKCSLLSIAASVSSVLHQVGSILGAYLYTNELILKVLTYLYSDHTFRPVHDATSAVMELLRQGTHVNVLDCNFMNALPRAVKIRHVRKALALRGGASSVSPTAVTACGSFGAPSVEDAVCERLQRSFDILARRELPGPKRMTDGHRLGHRSWLQQGL